MRTVLLLTMLTSFTGCYSYPTFNLREPIYIVQKPNYHWACDAHGFRSICRMHIINGIGMWFAHLLPYKRPQIILAKEAPKKSKNEVIFIDYDNNIKYDGAFWWNPRPLRIIVKNIISGQHAYFLMAHEFGHAILGPKHQDNPSIMHEDNGTLKPTPADIQRLHIKHPELSK